VTILGQAPGGAEARRETVKKYCAEVVGRENTQITHIVAVKTLEAGAVDRVVGHADEAIAINPGGPGLADQLDALNTAFGGNSTRGDPPPLR